MTALVTDPDPGNKRRLPAWMLQANAADTARKSVDAGTKCSEEENKCQAAKSKAKPVIKNHLRILSEEADTINQAETLPRCETRRRIKKATRSEEGPSTSTSTCGEAERNLKRKNVGDGIPANKGNTTRKKKLKSKRPKNSDVEEESAERSDGEISLTVGDLLSMAKEYVGVDKETKSKQHTTKECKSETNPSSLSISSKAVMGEAVQDGGSRQILSKCTISSCSSHLNENERKKSENIKGENFAINIIDTGDAAQDMLNLYLGPFLKKSSPKDPSSQTTESRGLPSVPSVHTIESKGLTSVRTMESKGLPSIWTIDHESKCSIKASELKDLPSIQSIESGLPSIYVSTKQLESGALMKEVAPLTKKKSSLKDKVAMFFD